MRWTTTLIGGLILFGIGSAAAAMDARAAGGTPPTEAPLGAALETLWESPATTAVPFQVAETDRQRQRRLERERKARRERTKRQARLRASRIAKRQALTRKQTLQGQRTQLSDQKANAIQENAARFEAERAAVNETFNAQSDNVPEADRAEFQREYEEAIQKAQEDFNDGFEEINASFDQQIEEVDGELERVNGTIEGERSRISRDKDWLRNNGGQVTDEPDDSAAA